MRALIVLALVLAFVPSLASADGTCTASALAIKADAKPPRLVTGCDIRHDPDGEPDIDALAAKLAHKPAERRGSSVHTFVVTTAKELAAIAVCDPEPKIDFAKSQLAVVVYAGEERDRSISAVFDDGKRVVLADRSGNSCHGGARPREVVITEVIELPVDRAIERRDCAAPPHDPPCPKNVK